MATKATKEITLADRLDRIEKLLFAPPKPSTQAATDGFGNPGTVVAGELIESAWGNAVRDHVIRVFPSVAGLNAWAAPDGALAEAPVGVFYLRNGGAWVRYGTAGALVGFAESTTPSGPYTGFADIPGINYTMTGQAGRLYRATVYVPIVERHLDETSSLVIVKDAAAVLNRAWWSGVDGALSTMIVTAVFQQVGASVVKAQLSGGTAPATVSIQASLDNRVILTIEDVGPVSFLPTTLED